MIKPEKAWGQRVPATSASRVIPKCPTCAPASFVGCSRVLVAPPTSLSHYDVTGERTVWPAVRHSPARSHIPRSCPTRTVPNHDPCVRLTMRTNAVNPLDKSPRAPLLAGAYSHLAAAHREWPIRNFDSVLDAASTAVDLSHLRSRP